MDTSKNNPNNECLANLGGIKNNERQWNAPITGTFRILYYFKKNVSKNINLVSGDDVIPHQHKKVNE